MEARCSAIQQHDSVVGDATRARRALLKHQSVRIHIKSTYRDLDSRASCFHSSPKATWPISPLVRRHESSVQSTHNRLSHTANLFQPDPKLDDHPPSPNTIGTAVCLAEWDQDLKSVEKGEQWRRLDEEKVERSCRHTGGKGRRLEWKPNALPSKTSLKKDASVSQ